MSEVPRLPLLIGGKLVQSKTTQWRDVINPATQEVVAQVPFATREELDLAVADAKEAFKTWRNTGQGARMRVMLKLQQLLRENTGKLAEMITREHGKTLPDAEGEVGRGLEVVEHACSIANLQLGEYAENAAGGIDVYTLIQPLGVCAGITAFNFPVMLPCFMFPIAVACGNTFVLMPSEQDPSSSLFLAQLALEAGLPPGVLNVVHGGPDIANGLCEHPDIKAVSFIGSTRVGTEIYNRASAAGKRCQSMMGAKNHCVILPDADPEVALNQLVGAAFGAAGQRCMATSVAVMVGEARNWLPDFVERAKKLKVNNGVDREADLGPLVSPAAKQRVEGLIQKGWTRAPSCCWTAAASRWPASSKATSSARPSSMASPRTWPSIPRKYSGRCCAWWAWTRWRTRSSSSIATLTATVSRCSRRMAARRAISRTTSTSARSASTFPSRCRWPGSALRARARIQAGRPRPQRQAGGAVLDADEDGDGALVRPRARREHHHLDEMTDRCCGIA